MDEFQTKQARMIALLDETGLDGLLLRKVSSFAWATCGAASYVNTAVSEGEASLLVTRDGRYLFTNNIEAVRLDQEEGLRRQGWEFRISPWYANAGARAVSEMGQSMKLGVDGPFPGAVDLSGRVSQLRSRLTTGEGERFRKLGRLCAGAMDAAIRSLQPGMTEFEAAARLAAEALARGAVPIVNLVASDERIFAIRHPLPTGKKIERYVMLVLCGRVGGLICSLTRLVYFGRLPADLRAKAEALANVEAAFLTATIPGCTLSGVFQEGTAAYARAGYPEEWKLHHQGGSAGYEAREVVATPDTHDPIFAGQAFAWNPSITGTKSEDTILIGEQGFEVLTEVDGWPVLLGTAQGKEIRRPAILEVD
jgi:antitoxin VapB